MARLPERSVIIPPGLLHISERASLSESILGMDMSYNSDLTAHGLDILKTIWPDFRSARLMGSSALGLAYTAAGRYDLYFHGGVSPWDQVSGMLLVEEAGGDYHGPLWQSRHPVQRRPCCIQ